MKLRIFAVFERLFWSCGRFLFALRPHMERTGEGVQRFVRSATGQVRTQSEGARHNMKQRMTMLELQHHLSRLYPQIGRLACDMQADQRLQHEDEELTHLVEQAQEYRQRLKEIEAERASARETNAED